MLASKLKKYHQGTCLNLEKVRKPLENVDGQELAKLIEENDASIKQIKTTHANFSKQTITAIAKALEKNIYITQFTFNYKNASLIQERKIKWQLILNKAQKQIMNSHDSSSKTWKILVLIGSTAFTFLHFLKAFSWQTAFVFTLIYQGLQKGIKKLIHNTFQAHHVWAKQKETPSSCHKTRSYTLGKRCAHESLIWLHPKSWTPLAYLGHCVEKNKLENHYGFEMNSHKKRAGLRKH